MRNINIWEQMGMLDAFESEYEKQAMTELYEDIADYIKSESFKVLNERLDIAEWWNSYLPNTDEEWTNTTGLRNAELQELKKICVYEDGILINALFDTAQDLSIKHGVGFYAEDIIALFDNVSLKQLIYTGNKPLFRTYGVLYDTLTQIILEECSTFIEINRILTNKKQQKHQQHG